MNPLLLPAMLIGILWVLIVVANVVLYPVLPASPSFLSIGTCLAGAICLILPLLVMVKPPPLVDKPFFSSYRDWFSNWPNKIALMAIPIMIIGASVDYSLSAGFDLGVGFADRRLTHLIEGVEFSPLRYVSMIAKSTGLIAIGFLVATRAPAAVLAASFLIAFSAGLTETFSNGGRAFLRATFSISLAAFLIGYSGWILKYRAKVAVATPLFFLSAIVANILFNKARIYNENEYAIIVRSGDVFLAAIGLPGLPNDIAYGFGTIVGYLITPVGYFDHFLDVHSLPPTLGAFTFQTIAARINFDFNAVKEFVDGYYIDFGIEHNIWATAFRELMIDTGPFFFLPVCLLIGFIMRSARAASARNPGALTLYIILFGWLLNSPFESILKVRYVEFALVLAILLTVASKFLYRAEKDAVGSTTDPSLTPSNRAT